MRAEKRFGYWWKREARWAEGPGWLREGLQAKGIGRAQLEKQSSQSLHDDGGGSVEKNFGVQKLDACGGQTLWDTA